MQKLTTAYCPKDGTQLQTVAQHKAGRDTGGLVTVFEKCPTCRHWLTYAAGSLSYHSVFVSGWLLPSDLPESKIETLEAAAGGLGHYPPSAPAIAVAA